MLSYVATTTPGGQQVNVLFDGYNGAFQLPAMVIDRFNRPGGVSTGYQIIGREHRTTTLKVWRKLPDGGASREQYEQALATMQGTYGDMMNDAPIFLHQVYIISSVIDSSRAVVGSNAAWLVEATIQFDVRPEAAVSDSVSELA